MTEIKPNDRITLIDSGIVDAYVVDAFIQSTVWKNAITIRLLSDGRIQMIHIQKSTANKAANSRPVPRYPLIEDRIVKITGKGPTRRERQILEGQELAPWEADYPSSADIPPSL